MDDEAIREITRRHARCILFWTRRRADVARRISFSHWRFRCCSRDGALRLRPTLLVGEAGTGKSRLARRVFERLGLPYTVAPVGGTADARLLGTAKGWSTGHGSVVAEAFLRHRKANPGLVVDELEKVGTSRHNGSLWDGLLGLLEPETSRRWLDP
ncbi:AAA domain-containing protein [Azospirillum sp. RWY-5-1]|uniref:AAA domain-containing protein n=1 Tax=Azospirillum oleiclasticum TaxID=2735135 RepID=A0ABX2TG77_9PROT|nr:AAA family ATPase [Azospirillum oleiclasticum]NYZ14851.1 AAA domain-containing protein [Azospirillum oleiclasticum]NYZ22163.1 AAA domain-containing protein [Azospirillum oleiclasticum]